MSFLLLGLSILSILAGAATAAPGVDEATKFCFQGPPGTDYSKPYQANAVVCGLPTSPAQAPVETLPATLIRFEEIDKTLEALRARSPEDARNLERLLEALKARSPEAPTATQPKAP